MGMETVSKAEDSERSAHAANRSGAPPAHVNEVRVTFLQARIARQKEIDASIAAKAEFEFLFDKPHTDNKKVRLAGPFTVESLSPHRMLGVDENDELIDPSTSRADARADAQSFAQMILCAEGRYLEGGEDCTVRRAAVFIGPEFGTVTRPDLVQAAKEAAEAGFDVLIACAFNYEAHATEFIKLGRIPVLKARVNVDLHMADELKNTGEVRSDGPEGIACWFTDTDYNEESFFVRHAYFLGANDPYSALKTRLKAEIDPEAWESLHSDTSRPFPKPKSGRIAVKVINHLGDEVMKVFKV